jgi:DNA replication protein DnaC
VLAAARSFLAGDGVPDEREDRSDEMQEHREAARRDLWSARIPRRFQYADLEDLEEHITKPLESWGVEPDRNLVLLGPVGTGKTHAAVAAARLPHMQGMHVGFCPTVELLDAMRPSVHADDQEDALDFALRVPLLILDDLAIERSTEWTIERLYAIVNRRWLDERPTIVTTNLAPEQIVDALGEQLYSRLAHDALALSMTGSDRRRW